MDINLGAGLNRLKATQEIRINPSYSKIPMVALTAYAFDGNKERYHQGGCTHYL